MKYKNIKTISLILILIVTTFFLIKEYHTYCYSNGLKKAYRNYNTIQKKCSVVGTSQNYIYLKRNKDDFSFNKGLSNSKWKLTNLQTKKEYIFVTGEDGYGGIVGLENGIYTLEEVSVPNNIEKISCKKTIVFDKSNSSYELKMGSSNRNNFIYIYTLDQDGDIVENSTYEIYDSLYNLEKTYTAKTGGMLYSNIDSDTYYIRNVDYDIYSKIEVHSCEEEDVKFIVRR